MISSPSSPAEEYLRRERVHEHERQRLELQHVWLGYGKLVLVLAILVTVWAAFFLHACSPFFVVVPSLLFAVTATAHQRVLQNQSAAIRGAKVYRRGLDRIAERWPRTTEHRLPLDLIDRSLYARDLDIVGKGSLFELLCIARTPVGERCLLDWLLEPASLETIVQRQHAISELRDQLDFREQMATVGDDGAFKGDLETLRAWIASSPKRMHSSLRWFALGLAVLAVGAVYVGFRYGAWFPLAGVLLVEVGVARLLKNEITAALKGLDHASQSLRLYSELLRTLERQTFQTDILKGLVGQLYLHKTIASDAIAHLETLAGYRDGLNNPFVKLLDRPLMYSLQLAFAVQRWRRQHGCAVDVWFKVLGEAEALLSIAGYSYEHPDDPFPAFVGGPASFEAHGIGHPLLPAQVCVRNSLSMGNDHRALLISGSNMSGKSTLMRTVGINIVLAMCGAPVRAAQMQLTPLRVATSLVVNDSLLHGSSRFYAEIKKLKQICELAQQGNVAVLFLLDEVLQGTNSKDRLIGVQGTLRELVGAGAIGILTTHDLSLTAMADEESWIRNMHFQDVIADGRMQFDYQLRDGVVAKSNGVELMRLIGLRI